MQEKIRLSVRQGCDRSLARLRRLAMSHLYNHSGAVAKSQFDISIAL